MPGFIEKQEWEYTSHQHSKEAMSTFKNSRIQDYLVPYCCWRILTNSHLKVLEILSLLSTLVRRDGILNVDFSGHSMKGDPGESWRQKIDLSVKKRRNCIVA